MNCLLMSNCPWANTERCNSMCYIYAEFDYLLNNSNIPEGHKTFNEPINPTRDDYQSFVTLREIKTDIANFVEDGRFLYIWSHNTGNYKTTWAMKMVKTFLAVVSVGNNFQDRAWVEYIPTFLLLAKNFEDKETRQEHIHRAMTNDLVVLDDIGAVQNTNYDLTNLSSIIDYRYSNNLATIFTSNVSPVDLASVMGARLCDRITSDIVINLVGASRRSSTKTYTRGRKNS